MRLVLGLDRPDSGDARVNGRRYGQLGQVWASGFAWSTGASALAPIPAWAR
jgi:hypothetical protein